MSDIITISQLLEGKSTLIKEKEFFPTKNYVEPFLDKMGALTLDFRIKVKTPTQVTVTQKEQDITYNRVLIEAVLPEKYCIDSHDEVIGMVYGLDVRKPIVKFYRGHLNQACTNLCVFNPNWLNIQELKPEAVINYNPIKELLESENDFAIKLEKMKNTVLDRNDQTNMLGKWVDNTLRSHKDFGYGKVKLTKTTPVDAYVKLFVDHQSPYFIPDGHQPSLFDVHNSFTQLITDDKRDIINKFEKTLLVNQILGIHD